MEFRYEVADKVRTTWPRPNDKGVILARAEQNGKLFYQLRGTDGECFWANESEIVRKVR